MQGVKAMELQVLTALLTRAMNWIRQFPIGWCSLWAAVIIGLMRMSCTDASTGMCANNLCCAGYMPAAAGGCEVCSPGGYCSTGYSKTACAAGKFNDLPGGLNSSWCKNYSTACPVGNYILSAPNATRNITCAACRALCNASQYKSGACGGAGAYDVVTCVACRTCDPGMYHTTPCDGTTTTDPPCVQCTSGGCAAGLYRGPCSQNQNGVCANCTRCPAGQYNKGCGGNQDGVCSPCTSCGVGWATYQACGALTDTVCKGGACNTSTTCGTLFCSYPVQAIPSCSRQWLDMIGGPTNFLCTTSATTGTCQECPPGWTATGAYCVECPSGQSCDTNGKPQCNGQCAIDYYPTCDPATTRSVCLGCQVNHTNLTLSHKALTRGGVLDAPELCGAYFQCATGYYMASVTTTAMGCLPCQWPEKTQSEWVALSHGLTFGDAYSCLYANATLAAPGSQGNEPGFYGAVRTSCPYGTTSRPGWAQVVADCVPCLSPPMHGSFVSQRYDCAVACFGGYGQRGEACLNEYGNTLSCPDEGYITYDGACASQPLPWSQPGWQFAGMPNLTALVPTATAALDSGYRATASKLYTPAGSDLCAGIVAIGKNLGYVQDIPLSSAVCSDTEMHTFYLLRQGGSFLYAFLERDFGNNNRYIMWQVETRSGGGYLTGKVFQTWRLPARVCSAAWTRVGITEYLYLSFCNTSFVAFVPAVDMTATADYSGITKMSMDGSLYGVNRQVKVLIGTDGVVGSVDGMRDAARFGYSLSVANTTDPQRLFVADQYNCRLVEILIDAPGSFLTRATSIGANSCYGSAGSLLFPRLITSMLGGAVSLFVTDAGVMQIDFSTRTIQGAVPDHLLPLDPAWMDASEGGSAVTLANGTHAAVMRRTQIRCPAHYASKRGKDCHTCPASTWASGAACAACTTTLRCPSGQRLIPCSDNADAQCETCTAPSPVPSYAHYLAPDCSVVPLAPCPPGYYNLTAGGDCTLCPSFASGAYTAADAPQAMVCGCFSGSGRLVNGTCVVPSPFATGIGPFPAPGWTKGLNCTYSECQKTGCFLSSAFPRVCANCPAGTVGDNGMWCETCPGFRDPSPTQSDCLCRHPSQAAVVQDACRCPVGHEILGSAGCSPCPPGSYQPDYVTMSDAYAAQYSMCSECPPGYGSQAAASDCAPCPPGLYREPGMQECARCANPLAYARDRATRASCRECRGACSVGEEWRPCAVNALLFACEPCTATIYGDREWVPGGDNRRCLWQCKSGFYQTNEPADCWPCSEAGLVCPPGKRKTGCTAYTDAHCDASCVNSSMPLSGAEWSGVGCEWRCQGGHTRLVKSLFGWTEYACVSQAERASMPWSGWW